VTGGRGRSEAGLQKVKHRGDPMKIQKKIEFFENFITAQPGKSTTSDESKIFFDFSHRVLHPETDGK